MMVCFGQYRLLSFLDMKQVGEEIFFNSHAVQQLQIRLEKWSDWKKQCGNEWNEKIVREFEGMSTTKLDDYCYVLTRLGFSIDSS